MTIKSTMPFAVKDPLGGSISLHYAHPMIGLIASDEDPEYHAAGVVLERENRAGLLNALREIKANPGTSISGLLSGLRSGGSQYHMVDFLGSHLTVHRGPHGAAGIAVSENDEPTTAAFLLPEPLGELIAELEKLTDVEDMTPAEVARRIEEKGR